jgi:hypothetical protein
VTAISRPDGTAARNIQRARVAQFGAGADQQDQQAVAAGPDHVLRSQREHRLEQNGIGQEREEAADVRRRIEEIRIVTLRMPGAHEPRLQQRIVGRKREERQADRHREQAEQPDRIVAGRRFAPARRNRQRQRQQRHREQ